MRLGVLLRKYIPPFLYDQIKRKIVHWRGDFSDWSAALQECAGYDNNLILEKTVISAEKLQSGEFPYERDSVLFTQIEYSWPVLCALLWAHARDGKLNVMDFGGSLGSTQFQNIKFLKGLTYVWNVVEQPQIAKIGQAKFQSDHLKFYDSVDACLNNTDINVVLISSTLQYLPEPLIFLKNLAAAQVPILILDRLSIIAGSKNRLTKQTVPSRIYKASYPSWFFSEEKILSVLQDKYELIEKFEAYVKNETYIDGLTYSSDYGYIFRLKGL